MGNPSSTRTKVLIADDNDQMRAMLKRFCPANADEIIECRNGEEAVAAYAEHQPDWVLMDVMMPRLDGLSATARIKAAYPDARIVIVTELNSTETRDAAHKAGATDFVFKDNLHALQQTFSIR